MLKTKAAEIACQLYIVSLLPKTFSFTTLVFRFYSLPSSQRDIILPAPRLKPQQLDKASSPGSVDILTPVSPKRETPHNCSMGLCMHDLQEQIGWGAPSPHKHCAQVKNPKNTLVRTRNGEEVSYGPFSNPLQMPRQKF